MKILYFHVNACSVCQWLGLSEKFLEHYIDDDTGPYLGFFCWGGGVGEAQVVEGEH
jgi:hypothetical protein